MTTPLRLRIAALHRSIVETVPCDGKANWREALHALPFPRAMCVYLNWIARMIPARRRKVRCADGFWNDDACRRRDAVFKLIEKIEAGDDLAPHYSGRVEHKGFALDRYDADGRLLNHKWRDKDFALNALGVHHLHLGDDVIGEHRSDDILFIAFGKDEAVCIMVGGHRHLKEQDLPELEKRVLGASFGIPLAIRGVETSGGWTPSERIQLARAGFANSTVVDGQVVMSMPISTAGTRTTTAHQASRILSAIRHVDELIDEPPWVAAKFEQFGIAAPASTDFEWLLDFGTLLLHERSTRTAFCIVEDRLGMPMRPGPVLLEAKGR